MHNGPFGDGDQNHDQWTFCLLQLWTYCISFSFSNPPPPRLGMRFVWWYDDGGVCAALWWRGWCGDIRSHDPAVTPPPGPYHEHTTLPFHTRLYFFLPPGHTIAYLAFSYSIVPDFIFPSLGRYLTLLVYTWKWLSRLCEPLHANFNNKIEQIAANRALSICPRNLFEAKMLIVIVLVDQLSSYYGAALSL